MSENMPHIHLFRNMDKYYFFDVNKHKILTVPHEVYKLLIRQKRTGDNVTHPILTELKGKGFLSSNRVKEVEHPYNDFLEDHLNNKLKKICLQITQQCNFRCSYCVYSGNYKNRNHSNKKMDIEIAKKGIDFLINHSRDSSSINIGFYGGEPLLEFDFVHECMKYASKAADGKPVSFAMTTNGSLLNEKIAEVLLKYNIMVTVSLDGPKEIHDKNRKFANGDGTFDVIYNNIKSVTQKYPGFKSRLQFSMVVDPTIEVNCLNEFVANEEDFFNNSAVMTTLITDINRKERLVGTTEFFSEWEYNKFKYFLHLLGKVSDRNISQLLRRSQIELFEFLKYSQMSYPALSEKDHHTGPCVPGQIRLFMTIDGEFLPCERVNETSEVMKIGNIDKGFDLEKVRPLLNIGKLTEENCKNCFALRVCTI